ncbi:O-antigen ligase family protein [Legionella dresdenensis]|uniref:O-antigen ligase family protein n=1 Tax=Legionella dresdenensis TaxID=450200 RepID=A0ABV8CEY8_9GAMM
MQAIEQSQPQWTSAKLVPILLPLLFFVTPLSSSGKSILMVLSILAIIAAPDYRRQIVSLFSQSWCKAAIALFALALVGCLWGPATIKEKMLVLEKYAKLLFLPILVVGLQNRKTRESAILAYIAAMALTAVLSVLVAKGVLITVKVNADSVFRNHIMTGIMMSFAAYLSALLFFRRRGVVRIAYLLLFTLFSYQNLFVSVGRTGYVIYLLLLGLLVLQTFSWKQALAGFAVIAAVFLGCYSTSDYMQLGVKTAVYEFQHYKQNKDTSIGYRIQFHNYAQQLFIQHPLFGNGTASFTASFRIDKPVPSWDRTLLEPHSQYWLVLVEFGLFGFAILAWLAISLLRATWRLSAMRPIGLALLAAIGLANFTDSLLFYSGSGYFFLLWMAACLGEKARSV